MQKLIFCQKLNSGILREAFIWVGCHIKERIRVRKRMDWMNERKGRWRKMTENSQFTNWVCKSFLLLNSIINWLCDGRRVKNIHSGVNYACKFFKSHNFFHLTLPHAGRGGKEGSVLLSGNGVKSVGPWSEVKKRVVRFLGLLTLIRHTLFFNLQKSF